MTLIRSHYTRLAEWVAAFVLFATLFATISFPAVTGFRGHWVVDGASAGELEIGLADAYLNAWILDWMSHHVLGGISRLFDTNIFYPSRTTLALSEHMIGNLPLYLLGSFTTGDAAFAYNFYIAASFVVAGLGAFFLMRQWGYAWWPAVLAGVVFSLCPVRMMVWMYGEVQLLGLYWLPWCLGFLVRYYRSGKTADVVLFGVLLSLQLLASFYLAYFAVIAVGILVLVHVLQHPRSIAWWRHAAVCVVGCASVAVFLLYAQPYRDLRDAGILKNHEEESPVIVKLNSADALRSYTTCVPLGGGNVYRSKLECPPYRSPQGRVFAGFMPLALATIGLLSAWMMRPRRCPPGAVLAMLAILLIAYVLSLGPTLVWDGLPVETKQGVGVELPYAWLARFVPGFSSMRAPARFALLAMLGLAFFAAQGLHVVMSAAPRKWFRAMLAVIAVGVVTIEYSFSPLRVVEVETRASIGPAYNYLAATDPTAPLLELPVGENMWDRAPLYVYRSTIHGHPLVNGYSGHFPPGYWQRRLWADRLPAKISVEQLSEIGVSFVLVHEGDPLLEARHRWPAMTAAGITIVAVFGSDVLYRLAAPGPDA